MDNEFETNLGISRRSLIKRGAVVGGTLVWAAPVVQSLSAPAYAAGTPACTVVTRHFDGTNCRTVKFTADTDCCECLNEGVGCETNPCSDRTVISDETTPGECPAP